MTYLQGNTLIDTPRLIRIRESLKETEHLPGKVAEIGLWRGGSARWICEHTNKHVLLFDTFEGMPEAKPYEVHQKGAFNQTSLEHVSNLLSNCNNYAIYKGIFPKETGMYAECHKFSLVHIDVDIYDSVKDCLTFFAPRMVQGGIIILDDYNCPDCPGAKIATDEFCKENNLVVTPSVQCQAIINF